MENKPYCLGVMVGRFQTLHAGHEDMIQKALQICDKVCILVGSSQESGTSKNPFNYTLREEMLRRVFGSEILIFPLPDIGVGNNAAWGDYVLKKVKENLGQYPDLLISAKESRRVSWFDSAEGTEISELYIPKTNPISATQMRQYFLDDDERSWRMHTNPKLWPLYQALRQQVENSRENLETDSI